MTKKILHRPGIEPGPSRWQREILPLDQRCTKDVAKIIYIIHERAQDLLEGDECAALLLQLTQKCLCGHLLVKKGESCECSIFKVNCTFPMTKAA